MVTLEFAGTCSLLTGSTLGMGLCVMEGAGVSTLGMRLCVIKGAGGHLQPPSGWMAPHPVQQSDQSHLSPWHRTSCHPGSDAQPEGTGGRGCDPGVLGFGGTPTPHHVVQRWDLEHGLGGTPPLSCRDITWGIPQYDTRRDPQRPVGC